MNQEERFKEYLSLNGLGKSAESYTSALKNILRRLNISDNNVFDYNIDSFLPIKKKIISTPSFLELNKIAHNNYSCAIQKYEEFLSESNRSMETLFKNYTAWVSSEDYPEKYKWDYIEECKDLFSFLDQPNLFHEKYLDFLNIRTIGNTSINFFSYSLLHGKRMFTEIYEKFPKENINIFKNLVNEDIPITQRITDFIQEMNILRHKVNWKSDIYKIDVQTASFFLFVHNPWKHPLATQLKFIKQYFDSLGIDLKNKRNGLKLYLFYYKYIHEDLLPLMKEKIDKECSAIDAQDFFWFIANNPDYKPPKNFNKEFKPRLISQNKETIIDEAEYTENVNKTELTKKDIEDLRKSYQNPPESITQTHGRYKRNPKIGKLALQNANYCCEADQKHHSFISGSSGKQYMEAHHLIPQPNSNEYWEKYKVNIDREENIVSICPNCHRAIHYGETKVKKEILELLLKKREKELKKLGVSLTLEELLRLY